MDKFIVSARKYRPQDFSTVVGQAHITTTLKNAIKNKQLAHAFLFCGPRGVGKTTCARILAKTINCENITPDGEACNRCPSCVSFNDGASLNIHELDAASNNSVDDIRTLVEQVRFSPQAGKYKVYIIDEVHMLSTSAFNAFLKTLEEPPPYAIFILATTEKHKILPTILSRCQIFDFKRITPADTVDHLQDICNKEEITAEKPALQMIAQKSEGCMRDALSILDKIVSFTNGQLTYQNTLEHLNILDADYYFRILDAMQQQDLSAALLIFDSINRKGFEGDLVLNGLAEFIRNLLVCKDEKVAMLLEVVESFRDRYITVGRGADASWLVSALNVLNEAEINYKSARNKRLHVELALIKLCYLAQALQITGGDPAAKKKQPDTLRPVSFRNIPAMELVRQPATERTATATPTEPGPQAGAKLLVENGASEPRPPVQPEQEPQKKAIPGTAAPAATSLGSLSRIRQQFSSKQSTDNSVNIHPLEPVALQKAWQQYADQLRENRNPAVQSLELATLRITDSNNFEVITNNNLEQKFIEQEKRSLSDHLQRLFSNKAISFMVIIGERAVVDEEPAERPLNKREQFIQIVEQYPLVKELKDRLKLELDY
ncbi:DNA polymerase III subunit gamma/tau [Puia sp.]|uniref:DNA polymerase III subunit gamma/tau n=1 Tax=Puia sp. TaxID=2045100 RepID=UPI002F42D6E1